MPMRATKTSTLAALQREGAARLREAGIDTAPLDARLLLCHAADLDHAAFISRGEEPARDDVVASFQLLIERRASSEPVARILGEEEFWGLSFLLGPETLVPRPDSEAIIAAALELVPDHTKLQRVLDLGTGTGCLLLALLSELPKGTGLGIDRSNAAVEVARANAARLGLLDRALFNNGNWADGLDETFDIIISNPPYIPSGEIKTLSRDVRDHDPNLALDGGDDGLGCYRELLGELPRLLKPQGFAVLETSPDLYTELLDLTAAVPGIEMLQGIKDLAGRWRGMCLAKAEIAN